jgi:hypothetical protein
MMGHAYSMPLACDNLAREVGILALMDDADDNDDNDDNDDDDWICMAANGDREKLDTCPFCRLFAKNKTKERERRKYTKH